NRRSGKESQLSPPRRMEWKPSRVGAVSVIADTSVASGPPMIRLGSAKCKAFGGLSRPGRPGRPPGRDPARHGGRMRTARSPRGGTVMGTAPAPGPDRAVPDPAPPTTGRERVLWRPAGARLRGLHPPDDDLRHRLLHPGDAGADPDGGG